jgi:broad specificity phosphatase PhoE
MDQIIVSRHGQSVAVAEGIENGDPATDAGLTAAGQEAARELGRHIAHDPIELCITSRFPRAQQTAALALSGRAIAFLVDQDLDDIRYGEFEGQPTERYRAWVKAHDRATPLPGGESRMQVAARLCRAFDAILQRPECCALVVTHELLIALLLCAMDGQPLGQMHPDIPYATPYCLAAADVARGAVLLRESCSR